MQFTLNRNEIKEAVTGFGKIISGKSSLPVLGCVRLSAKDGAIVAQATDLDQVLEYRFGGAQVAVEGACILPFVTLKDLSKGGKGEQVEIEAEDRITLTNHVGGHAVRQSVAGMDLDEWPGLVTDIPTQPALGFLETYRRLVPFSSTDATRFVINSVFVEVGKGVKPVTMAATDGRRLACFNSMELPLKKSIVLPVTKFLAWNKLTGDIEIGVREDDDGAWLGVKAGPFYYVTKTVDGTYPNYRQVIPAVAGEHVITFTDADVQFLKSVLPSFPGDESITIVGNDGKVTLYGRGPDDKQWTPVQLKAVRSFCGRAFICVNRQYLLDAFEAGFQEFAITDELCPLLSRDGKGGVHVLMPWRAVDPETEAHAVASSDVAVSEPVTDASVSEPEPKMNPTKPKEEQVAKNEQKNEMPTLERVLASCDAARARVKDAGQALSELSAAIKDVAREQKTQSKEVESARTALAKLQAISL